jgi:hypothetical protein
MGQFKFPLVDPSWPNSVGLLSGEGQVKAGAAGRAADQNGSCLRELCSNFSIGDGRRCGPMKWPIPLHPGMLERQGFPQATLMRSDRSLGGVWAVACSACFRRAGQRVPTRLDRPQRLVDLLEPARAA